MAGRAAATAAQTLLRRRFLVSMEVTNLDASYDWMMRWLSSQPSFKVQQMSVMTRNTRIYSNDSTATQFYFGPCTGVTHYFFYKGRPITLFRRRNERQDGSGNIFEVLQMSTIGLSTSIFESIIKEAHQHVESIDNNNTIIYTNGGGRWMRQQEPRARRPFESVVYPGNLADELRADARRFLDSGDYYRKLGVPYRRGYLLHGPPGCGKTSYVMALAGQLNLSISLLSLSNRGLTDETLMQLLNTTEARSIVLIEDIDRAFGNESGVTMSGLLNALDGVGAQEGNIVFMTTNHVEKLDAALIRPGRADVKIEVGLLDADQARRMFAKFYPDTPPSLQEDFGKLIPPNAVSVAQIQSHLFYYRDNPQGAVDHLSEFLKSCQQFENEMERKRKESVQKMKQMGNLPRTPILDF
ncbi:mitochondrial chaperone BCS1 [Angomonas deanei]|nr:mitochondrial chaperone BCS1 [Angomonas deanei]|eukprot:EPY38187.1 mitochondrial chaperone BCS1 [Angomonas deanei]